MNKYMLLVIISIAAGLLSGIFRPMFFSDNDLGQLTANLQGFVAYFGIAPRPAAALAESLLIYGRPLLLIWACAPLGRAFYAAYLLLYLRALAFGFSTAMMVRAFGGQGLAYAAALYLPQNILIVPIYAYTIYQIGVNRAEGLRPLIPRIAAVGVLGVLATVILEVYITPAIFTLFG